MTPDFRKSLNIEDVLPKEVIVAYAMNGEPLPYLNGFPLRLVVPGWYASYWIKALSDIEVLNVTVDQELLDGSKPIVFLPTHVDVPNLEKNQARQFRSIK